MVTLKIHQEVRIAGQWHHYGVVSVDGKLWAGGDSLLHELLVGDNGMVSPLRGLPDDATIMTFFAYEAGEVGSPNWFDAHEIDQLYDNLDYAIDDFDHRQSIINSFGSLFGNSWGSFITSPTDYPARIEDVRWVIWLD